MKKFIPQGGFDIDDQAIYLNELLEKQIKTFLWTGEIQKLGLQWFYLIWREGDSMRSRNLELRSPGPEQIRTTGHFSQNDPIPRIAPKISPGIPTTAIPPLAIFQTSAILPRSRSRQNLTTVHISLIRVVCNALLWYDKADGGQHSNATRT